MQKLIIANWKSQKTLESAEVWWKEFSSAFSGKPAYTIVIAPPFPLIPFLKNEIKKIPAAALGAQDVSSYPMGSYTGAVNAQQLKDLGVQYVIVGHSERRKYFHETHEDVARKVQEVIAVGMTPVLCLDKTYIEEQAAAMDSSTFSQCVVAYEPLAAIGSGQPEDVGTVQTVISQIKATFGDIPVLYGGSVNEQNSREYLLVSDGILVGSASLDAHKFVELIPQE